MTVSSINPALHFVATVGVKGFVTGVQTGMVKFRQFIEACDSINNAIDIYQARGKQQDESLAELCREISSMPRTWIFFAGSWEDKMLDLLSANGQKVDRAVRMAIEVTITGGAAVANVEAPYDLGGQLKWIPPGECQMGSRDDDPYAFMNEKPLRTVITGGYFLLDHPVTNAEFEVFLKATGREDVRNLSQKLAGGDQPAVGVTFEEAVAYSKWLGETVSNWTGHAVIGRLPTEVEWEKAAKGPSGNEFTFRIMRTQAHFNAEATRRVNHPNAYVNGYGLKDMIGNVEEWTSSTREEGKTAVVRGAAWNCSCLRFLRAAYTGVFLNPLSRLPSVGFRPLLALQL